MIRGAVVVMAWLAVLALTPPPARSQDKLVQALVPPLPIALTVMVIAPDDPPAPDPTGTVTLYLGDRPLLTGRVGSTLLLTVTADVLAALRRDATVGYSGDGYYARSDPVPVPFPGRGLLKIPARARASVAPAAELVSSAGAAISGGVAPTRGSSTVDTPGGSAGGEDRGGGRDASGAALPASAVAATASSAADTAPSAPGGRPGPARPVRTSRSPSNRSASGRARATGTPPKRASDTGHRVAAKPPRPQLKPYDPRSKPAQTVGIIVAAFTLLQLGVARGGLALAGGGGGVGRSDSSGGSASHGRSGSGGGPRSDSAPGASFDYEGVEVEQLGGSVAAVAVGDRSRTWGWPGTRTLDAIGAAVPARIARRSPLLARITADGTYLRAIFGSASLAAAFAGAVLGFAALRDVGGDAMPPAAALTIAIAVLGVFDALAGFVAVLIFATGVLVPGGIDSDADLRLMCGLGALWFVVPVLAGAARPLRRHPARGLDESWDRAADFVIASLVGSWAVQKMVLGLPALAGVELELTRHANTAAYCVLGALVVRLGLETAAAHLYPRRLGVAAPGDLPQPGAVQRLAAAALRTATFVFFASIVVGSSWQLWAGAALFVIPGVLAVYAERVPNSPGLYRALPKGLVELVLVLFAGTGVGALLIATMNENARTFVANSFVALALPGFLLSLLALFGRDGDEPALGWGKRIAGVGVLVLGVLAALGAVP
jgi:hypothetical protein